MAISSYGATNWEWSMLFLLALPAVPQGTTVLRRKELSCQLPQFVCLPIKETDSLASDICNIRGIISPLAFSGQLFSEEFDWRHIKCIYLYIT